MVYVPTSAEPLSAQQLFGSLLPKVEITKVTLEYQRTGGYQSTDPKTLEAIFDRNPHIDVNISGLETQQQRAERSEELASSTTTTVAVDLQIQMQQGVNAFPSVLNEPSIRQAMKIHLCYTLSQSEFGAASVDVERLQNLNPGQKRTILFADWEGTDQIPDRVIFNGSQKLEVYNYKARLRLSGEISDLGIVTYAELDPTLLAKNLSPNSSLRPAEGDLSGLMGRIESLSVLRNNIISSTSTIYVDSNNNIWTGPVYEVNKRLMEVAFANDSELAALAATSPADPRVEGRKQEIRDRIETIADQTRFIGNPIHHSDLMFLRQIEIATPKVQDFRIAHKIEALSMDFSITENDIFANLKKDLRGQRIKINKPRANFSDIFLSRDIGNNCRFFFSINWKRIILENSLFGLLFEEATNDELTNLLDRCSIKSLNIWRHRIEGSGEIGSNPTDKPFEENQKAAFIVGSKDENTGTDEHPQYELQTGLYEGTPNYRLQRTEVISPAPLPKMKKKATTAASFSSIGSVGYERPVAETKIISEIVSISDAVSIEESGQRGWLLETSDLLSDVNMQTRANQQFNGVTDKLRHFTGVDGFVKAQSDGYYKYETEIECFDKSIELIDEKNTQLLKHIDVIKAYYSEATRLRTTLLSSPPAFTYAGNAPWMSPYIDTPGEHEYEPGDIREGFFSSKTNRFSDEFRAAYTDRARNLISSIRDTIDHSDINTPGFVQILKFFSNKKASEVVDPLRPTPEKLWTAAFTDEIKTALLDYLNPYSATPESINIVLQLMQTVASKIESILGVVYETIGTTNTNTGQVDTVRKKHLVAKNRSFILDRKSDTSFNANLRKNLGLDFLNTTDLTKGTAAGSGMRPGTTGDFLFRDSWHNEWVGTTRNQDRPAGLYEIPKVHIGNQVLLETGKLFDPGIDFLAPLSPTAAGSTPLWYADDKFTTETTKWTYFTPQTIVLPFQSYQPENIGGRRIKPEVRNFTNEMFLEIIPWALYNQQSTSKTWLQEIINGTGINSFPLVPPDLKSNSTGGSSVGC